MSFDYQSLFQVFLDSLLEMSSITFHSCHFNLFFCSGPQKLTLQARVNSFLLWSDGMGYREAAACITRTCRSRPLWTHWVQRVALSSPASPVPSPGHLAAGQPMAKELWRGRRLQVHWPRRLAVELQSGHRWPSTTLRRNRRSPPTFPKSSSSITRPQCACVETKHKRLFFPSALHVQPHLQSCFCPTLGFELKVCEESSLFWMVHYISPLITFIFLLKELILLSLCQNLSPKWWF